MIKSLLKTLLPLILFTSATDLIHAQHDGGMHARLRAAVEAGEISQAQAEAMTSAMRKAAPSKDEKVGRRLREAVAAGDLTKEQARAMYEAYSAAKHAPRAERQADGDNSPRGKERMMIFRERLAKGVKSGEMTRAEAGEKWAAAEKRMQQASRSDRAPRAERRKNADKKEAKKSICENCGAQKQYR